MQVFKIRTQILLIPVNYDRYLFKIVIQSLKQHINNWQYLTWETIKEQEQEQHQEQEQEHENEHEQELGQEQEQHQEKEQEQENKNMKMNKVDYKS